MTKESDKHRVEGFKEILDIIESAKLNAYRAVNRELINMYRAVGEYVSKKVETGAWGKGIVNEIAAYIQQNNPCISGFSPQNLWRMKQFYETYKDDEILSTLSRELSWTVNTRIMAGKTAEEREFYLRMATKNNYSYRELNRQMNSCLYERTALSRNSFTNASFVDRYDGLAALRDSYVLEFLDMPKNYKEKDLRKAIVDNLKEFILEFGRDFSFIGEEYRIQVGDSDFYIDLIFYNRELSCLVAVELKTEPFRPEQVGQMQFYLEALDRDVKKNSENPSVGLILCTDKDDMVVEYTLAKSSAPSLIAAYELALPDKKLLQQRVKELTLLAGRAEGSERSDRAY
ncbi:MAG: PDDEXK nuclease domain-containing protein [Methanomassiliicoccaceae archaeon]|nr:PDDEXK nuclease domain-containing protein [Methanomassiliicoccaceae archaeon]MCL2145612.1 PDDEXK nuclease domain-containing protein [Methanomassiliicoccaceae archaeon]